MFKKKKEKKVNVRKRSNKNNLNFTFFTSLTTWILGAKVWNFNFWKPIKFSELSGICPFSLIIKSWRAEMKVNTKNTFFRSKENFIIKELWEKIEKEKKKKEKKEMLKKVP